MDSALSIERFGAQRRITINRIEKHNALSRDVLDGLARAVRIAAADPSVNYVVIRGDGARYFAAGGDLVDLATIRSVEATAAFASTSRSALDAIRDSAVPVIAWLNGDALGGGAELALACDLRVMTPGARIGYVQSRLAITSAWGGAADLCAVVGPSRALRMMARAEMIGAAQALAEGLADAVLDGGPDDVAARVFFAPLDAASRHVLIAIKANVAACRSTPTYQAAREVEHANLIATWTHPAHWAAVDRVFTRSRSEPR
ncbi:MAG: enoyl-CoA hydratase/isomerase family protein [Burkholderiaceae bacterium]